MARNSLAGKHPSYTKLGMSPAAIKKKQARDKKNNAKPSSIKYRTELNRANRKAGTYGNKDGRDASHTKSGKIVMAPAKKNRAANGQGKKSRFHA